jgi:hypothetical protein
MWTTEEEDAEVGEEDEDDDGGLGKKELVDGLIAAVSVHVASLGAACAYYCIASPLR